CPTRFTTARILWMHCASYGEFEQGRPLLEEIRRRFPSHQIILSFFSPSGFNAFKNWKGADLVTYLPYDTRSNATRFLNHLKPDKVIFVKYEFWLNFLSELRERNIPSYLISAVFKSHHPFFRWYGGVFRESLSAYTRIFVQDKDSLERLESIGIKQVSESGDTRVDRVLEIRRKFTSLPFFETYCLDAQVLVAGSTWPKDEELILQAWKQMGKPGRKLILVPHEVDAKSIADCENRLKASDLAFSRYSSLQEKTGKAENILLLDTMGLLSRLYHYAALTYIGGGLDSGIHNCLEPAVYGKTVFFAGHSHHKYNEAMDLIAIGAARPLNNSAELTEACSEVLEDADKQRKTALSLEIYFKERAGTTEALIKSIFGV
ncbi:MAG TPA: glycosyltransferase N-terminal domain-containing protein, partial [Bacteroidia bacterium]|nr:glycosyltransferase N-terminal domain-containing protein [Bacteroidia bacterium]